MTAHTPGPWYAEQPAAGFSAIREEKTGKLVFALAHPSPSHGDDAITDEEKYANLNLLAAAPELLEALRPFKRFLDAFEATPIRGLAEDIIYAVHGGDGFPHGASLLWEHMRAARAAIQKASGALSAEKKESA